MATVSMSHGKKIENCQIVGLPMRVKAGLQEALKRLDSSHGFSQYTEMLKALRPEFVSRSRPAMPTSTVR